MTNLHMLIGIPGSGKSTYSKVLSNKNNAIIVSSDKIRKDNPGINEAKVFPEVYRLCAHYLAQGIDVILDATNIDYMVRKSNIDEIRAYYRDFEVVAYYFNVPVDICKKRVEIRNLNKEELYLPVEVCSLYSRKIQVPVYEEGFIKIIEIN